MQFLNLLFASSLGHASLPVVTEHWLPLQRSGSAVTDAVGDVDGEELDIVGDADHPAGQWMIDEDNLYIRVRLADSPWSPSITGKLIGDTTTNGWGILINRDADTTQYEYLVSLDEQGGMLSIESGVEEAGWTAAPDPMATVAEFSFPLSSSKAMVSEADSTLGDSGNYFIDISVPRANIDLAESGDTVQVALVTDSNRMTLGFEFDIAAVGPSTALAEVLSDPIGIDADADGLTVAEERAAGTDPTTADTDGDGYTDLEEILLYSTDPLDPEDPDETVDEDCDSIPDAIDPFVDLDTDPDEDGLTSAEEIDCASDPCSTDLDIDGDGIENTDEDRCGGNPCVSEEDIDGDGVSSIDEILAGTDPCVSDLAEDTGDPGETSDTGETEDTGESSGGSTTPQEDADCDGILDDEDDIVEFVADEDNDGDGISNGLEINQCNTDPCTYDIDPDQDMVSNTRETECGTNPCRPDTDVDGIWDHQELGAEGCGPDSDGDGVIDALDPSESTAQDPVQPKSGTSGFVEGDFTGGSCSHAPNRPTLPLALVALMLLFCRRPNRAALCIGFLIPAPAIAQSFNASSFTPTPSPGHFVGLRDPGHFSAAPTASMFIQHSKDPLIYRIEDGSRDDVRVLGKQWSAVMAGGYHFGRWDLAIQLPTHIYAQGDAFEQWGSFGDLAFHGGITLLPREQNSPGLGLSGHITAPTGDEIHWLGSRGLTGTTNVDISVGNQTVFAARLGTRFEQPQTLGSLETGTQLHWRTGVRTSIATNLGAAIEIMAAHQVKSLDQPGGNSAELLGSGHYVLGDRWTIHLGGGTGVARGVGTPDLRLLAGFRYAAPRTQAAAKNMPESVDNAFIQLSVTNHEDQPVQSRAILVEAALAMDTNEAGQADTKLPAGRHTLRINQPGYAPIQRILDLSSGTSITLAVVLSPSRVEVSDTQILIQDRIFFETGSATIEAASHSILDEVAMVMLDDKTLLMVEVQGHTDDVGDENDNLRLSQERAESVKQYLERAGVEEHRLQAMGFGETRPLATGDTDAARTQNRRVEFHVVRRGMP